MATLTLSRTSFVGPMRKRHAAFLHSGSALSAMSPLFALQALANSRETQHFNKASGLSRIEHSPNLELLRSSEVDPFQDRSGASATGKAAAGPAERRERKTSSASAFNTAPVSPRSAARQEVAASLAAARADGTAQEVRDLLFKLERKYEILDAAWSRDRRLLVRQFRRHSRWLASLCVLLGAFVAWLGLSAPSYTTKQDVDGASAVLPVDRKAMWANAANAMSGTKKEAYSATQPTSTVPAAEVQPVPEKTSSGTPGGWFWRR